MHTDIHKFLYLHIMALFIFDGDWLKIHCNYLDTRVFVTVKTVPVIVRSPKSSNVGPG